RCKAAPTQLNFHLNKGFCFASPGAGCAHRPRTGTSGGTNFAKQPRARTPSPGPEPAARGRTAGHAVRQDFGRQLFVRTYLRFTSSSCTSCWNLTIPPLPEGWTERPKKGYSTRISHFRFDVPTVHDHLRDFRQLEALGQGSTLKATNG